MTNEALKITLLRCDRGSFAIEIRATFYNCKYLLYIFNFFFVLWWIIWEEHAWTNEWQLFSALHVFDLYYTITYEILYTKFFGNTSSLVTPVTVTYKWVNDDDITMSFECVENNNDSRSIDRTRRTKVNGTFGSPARIRL